MQEQALDTFAPFPSQFAAKLGRVSPAEYVSQNATASLELRIKARKQLSWKQLSLGNSCPRVKDTLASVTVNSVEMNMVKDQGPATAQKRRTNSQTAREVSVLEIDEWEMST
jgi:hypothetical protein